VSYYNFDMKLFAVNFFWDQFVPRFKNLKRLEFGVLCFEPSPSSDVQARVRASEFCEKERFWHIFPKLETIKMQVDCSHVCPFIAILKRWE